MVSSHYPKPNQSGTLLLKTERTKFGVCAASSNDDLVTPRGSCPQGTILRARWFPGSDTIVLVLYSSCEFCIWRYVDGTLTLAQAFTITAPALHDFHIGPIDSCGPGHAFNVFFTSTTGCIYRLWPFAPVNTVVHQDALRLQNGTNQDFLKCWKKITTSGWLKAYRIYKPDLVPSPTLTCIHRDDSSLMGSCMLNSNTNSSQLIFCMGQPSGHAEVLALIKLPNEDTFCAHKLARAKLPRLSGASGDWTLEQRGDTVHVEADKTAYQLDVSWLSGYLELSANGGKSDSFRINLSPSEVSPQMTLRNTACHEDFGLEVWNPSMLGGFTQLQSLLGSSFDEGTPVHLEWFNEHARPRLLQALSDFPKARATLSAFAQRIANIEGIVSGNLGDLRSALNATTKREAQLKGLYQNCTDRTRNILKRVERLRKSQQWSSNRGVPPVNLARLLKQLESRHKELEFRIAEAESGRSLPSQPIPSDKWRNCLDQLKAQNERISSGAS